MGAASTLVNPRSRSLASLQNGKAQYETYCITCHGASGLGDGPVSISGEIAGPFIGVLPIAGPASVAKVRSEGHIYNTIRYGRRRMPNYRRISSEDVTAAPWPLDSTRRVATPKLDSTRMSPASEANR